MSAIITLTTDFQTQDGYVGAMKGVLLRICPSATIIDNTHDIEPFNLVQAAWVIRSMYASYPENTIHIVVVDPGVGSTRRPVCIQSPSYRFVGPDNGILGLVLENETERHAADSIRVIDCQNTHYFQNKVSNTFHGRDVFAPLAAHLARGTACDQFGPALPPTNLAQLPHAKASFDRAQSMMCGQVIHVDRFGNCITNILDASLEPLGDYQKLRVEADGIEFGPVRASYHRVHKGHRLALIGSQGLLELAISQGNLSLETNIKVNTQVRVRLLDGTRR